LAPFTIVFHSQEGLSGLEAVLVAVELLALLAAELLAELVAVEESAAGEDAIGLRNMNSCSRPVSVFIP
jgi:hypothetical protein